MKQTDDATVESAGGLSTRPHTSAAKRNRPPIQIGSVVQNVGRHAAGERTQEEGEGDQGEHRWLAVSTSGCPSPTADWNTASPNCRRLPVGMVDA